ncbi:MAG: RidA family protein [Thermaceae bacterium]|nr:RidA family protein [Thermaceae bacterium]
MGIEARLAALGLVLPEVRPQPTIKMRLARRSGNLLYLSGNGPLREGQPAYTGKLGREVSLEQGYAAAQLTALNLLAVIKAELGDLEPVRFVKTLGFINSAPGFNQQPAVLNGFADLIVELYGEERGLHARSAVGMAELPWDIPVEIESIVEVVEG